MVSLKILKWVGLWKHSDNMMVGEMEPLGQGSGGVSGLSLVDRGVDGGGALVIGLHCRSL